MQDKGREVETRLGGWELLAHPSVWADPLASLLQRAQSLGSRARHQGVSATSLALQLHVSNEPLCGSVSPL